jgi:hypothetical protein
LEKSEGVFMSNHRLPTLVLALLAPLALGACYFPAGPLTAHDTVEETRALDPNGRFELENVNGRINLTTGSENEVRIEARRSAVSDEALERIRIDIDGGGDAVRVKTRYPRQKGWFMGGTPGKVDYDVTVPEGARVQIKTVNGPVNVEGIAGDLRVESVNGGLELDDLGGEVHAETVNGGIHVSFDRTPSGGHHRFETVNGGIEVALPEDTAGRLEASTVNGSIDCDLPLDVETKKKRRLTGRLGPGAGTFRLETVNGGIDVQRRMGRPPAESAPETS